MGDVGVYILLFLFGWAHSASVCILATSTRGGVVTGDPRLVYFFASSCPDAQAHQRILPFLFFVVLCLVPVMLGEAK